MVPTLLLKPLSLPAIISFSLVRLPASQEEDLFCVSILPQYVIELDSVNHINTAKDNVLIFQTIMTFWSEHVQCASIKFSIFTADCDFCLTFKKHSPSCQVQGTMGHILPVHCGHWRVNLLIKNSTFKLVILDRRERNREGQKNNRELVFFHDSNVLLKILSIRGVKLISYSRPSSIHDVYWEPEVMLLTKNLDLKQILTFFSEQKRKYETLDHIFQI